MSVIDEVKQKTDIIEVVSQYTSLTKAGRTFRALCPFHTEKTPSFFVYPEQQSWYCFGACSTGGDAFSFVMKKEGVDFGEALRRLADRAGITIPSRFESDRKREEKERLYQANEAAAQYFHNLLINSPAGQGARGYLASRALSAKAIADFQLGLSLNSWEALKQYLMARNYSQNELLEAGLIVAAEDGKTHDRFRNRLMFPIKDARGRTIGFGARALDDSLPKYLNSPQTPIFDKSGSLYAIDRAASAIRRQDSVVIVEGYMDVITAHQNSFENVVASMGTAVTDRQINTLKRLTGNVALALDADAAGEEAMLRCVSYENILGSEIKVIVLPQGKDPDDVIREDSKAWQSLLEKAVPVMDYTFDMITAHLDLTAPRDKSLAVDRLSPLIAEIRDVVRQAHYLQKLAHLVNVNERNLEAALRRASREAHPPRPARESTKPADTRRILFASPREEHCLVLLLQHPELKARSQRLLPEYFQSSANREIFTTWQETGDLSSLRDRLDNTIWEHLDALIAKKIPSDQIERRYDDCVLRLQEEYLRGLERKREAVFALEAQAGGSGADLAKLKEEGIEPSLRLREVFSQRTRKAHRQGG